VRKGFDLPPGVCYIVGGRADPFQGEKRMRIVAVVGFSESGKTLLLTGLIGEFKRRGLRTFAVKHCPHGFSLDPEGKDTWMYTQAGADGVVMVSPGEWAVLCKEDDADLLTLAGRLFAGADVILVEGGKRVPGLRKIEVLRPGISEVVETRPNELLAVVTESGAAPGAAAPVFGLKQAAAICDLILAQEEETMSNVQLEVDGQNVPLNPFVRSFIEKTVLGMIAALSGVEPDPAKIVLAIDRKASDRENP
jgi:molybdopterin-guanine dinucleotide biosynthesis protein MobB